MKNWKFLVMYKLGDIRMEFDKNVGRGHIYHGVIATGNHLILIRCAEHHPADALKGMGVWYFV